MSNYCLLHCYIAVKVLKSSLHVCFWCIPLWKEHLGANGETQHSLSLSSLPSAEMCLSASREFKLLPFLKPTKCRFSSKLMQMFRNWVSNICKCFSLLDKNVWPLKSLGVYCFQKEKVDRTIIQHLWLRWKDWWSLLEGLGDVAGKILWKIYNQDISWHIKNKS